VRIFGVPDAYFLREKYPVSALGAQKVCASCAGVWMNDCVKYFQFNLLTFP